ncbi:MAG: DNA gyrase inhibitor YacG [Pseudomonadota bacterium]
MRCPICRKAASERYKPFCSRRCADVDLGRWMNEAYALPDAENTAHEGESDAGSNSPPKQP